MHRGQLRLNLLSSVNRDAESFGHIAKLIALARGDQVAFGVVEGRYCDPLASSEVVNTPEVVEDSATDALFDQAGQIRLRLVIVLVHREHQADTPGTDEIVELHVGWQTPSEARCHAPWQISHSRTGLIQ